VPWSWQQLILVGLPYKSGEKHDPQDAFGTKAQDNGLHSQDVDGALR